MSAYILYLSISSFITIYIGWKCYTYGFVYLRFLINDIRFCTAINRLLLIGYYLVNIGYIAWSISSWDRVNDWSAAFGQVANSTGAILLILCVLHYINMTTIYIISKQFSHHKKSIL